MKSTITRRIALIILACAGTLLAASSFAYGANHQALTGTVSDSMCGAQHMGGTPAECTRTCVSHGAKYTLVVGEKLYTLNTDNKAIRAQLDKEAGKNITVTGTVTGIAVDVSSVAPAK